MIGLLRMKIIKQGRPRLFWHENVTSFPLEEMRRILSTSAYTPGTQVVVVVTRLDCLKNSDRTTLARRTGFSMGACALCPAGPEFVLQSCELQPEMYGFPIKRRRQYVMCFDSRHVTMVWLGVLSLFGKRSRPVALSAL